VKRVSDLYVPGILSCRSMHNHDTFMARVSYRTSNPLVIRLRFMDSFKVDITREWLWQVVAQGTSNDCALIGFGSITLKVLRSDRGTFCASFEQKITDEQRDEHNRATREIFADDVNAMLKRILEPGQHPRVYALFRRADFYGWLQNTFALVPAGSEVPDETIDATIAKILEGSK